MTLLFQSAPAAARSGRAISGQAHSAADSSKHLTRAVPLHQAHVAVRKASPPPVVRRDYPPIGSSGGSKPLPLVFGQAVYRIRQWHGGHRPAVDLILLLWRAAPGFVRPEIGRRG